MFKNERKIIKTLICGYFEVNWYILENSNKETFYRIFAMNVKTIYLDVWTIWNSNRDEIRLKYEIFYVVTPS